MASYLVHFNRQHDPKTGMFTFGDGDGDGVRNDHANQGKTVDERKMSNRGYDNASKLFDVQRSTIRNTPTKGTSTGSGKYTKEKSAASRDNHIDPKTGKYDRNKTYVDDAKMTNSEYRNASNKFSMERSINKTTPTKGQSFINNSGAKDLEYDEQKLSKSDEAKEIMRRNFGYTMIDLTEEDEEKKKKKKGKYTQSHWGDNFVTAESE